MTGSLLEELSLPLRPRRQHQAGDRSSGMRPQARLTGKLQDEGKYLSDAQREPDNEEHRKDCANQAQPAAQ